MATKTRNRSSVENVKDEGERAARKAAYSPQMEFLARLGYAVRGLLYVTIGAIALQAALGKTNSPTDQIGAIAAIGSLPTGRILIWVMLVGLAAYSLWGLVRAIANPFHKTWTARLGYVVSAVSYAFFALTAFGLLRGTSSGGGGDGQMIQFISRLMQMPAGRIAVAVIGVAVLLGGLFQIYAGITENFDQTLKTYVLTPDEYRAAKDMGKIGMSVRGLVIGITGFFLILAATSADPSKARGFSGALTFLDQQPYGIYLLGIIAAGLIFLGLYSLMSAAWFRLRR
ncbi:MAG TPA: DUF1206 domain-containing protein [Anaerolineales bacterium]|nr:DUF1206 domain-containing protein [Anaerolineales bacterium]